MTHPVPSYLEAFRLSKEGTFDLLQLYMERFDVIREEFLQAPGVKQSIVYADGTVSSDHLRVGLVMSDLYELSVTNLGECQFCQFTDFVPHEGLCSVEGSSGVCLRKPRYHVEGNPVLGVGVLSAKGAKFNRVLAALDPVIEAGLAMVTPHGAVFTLDKEQEHSINLQRMKVYGAESSWPRQEWVEKVIQLHSQDDGDASAEGKKDKVVGEILVPYLRGVPLRELSRILVGEGDKLAGFRAALREAATGTLTTGGDAEEILGDIVRPELEKLSRAFKSVSQLHAFRVGGALVFAAAASLLIGANPIVGTVLGTGGGAAAFRDVIQWVEKRDDLRNNRWFVLWRLDRRKRQLAK